MIGHYILNKYNVAVDVDLMTWARWMEKGRKSVALTELPGMIVSTCFLGLDHNWGEGEPLLFETMVFKSDWSGGGTIMFPGGTDQVFGVMRRYSHWGQAMAGHNQAVAGLRARFNLPVPYSPGNPHAIKRRMRALWEIHYERLHTAKLEADTRGPAEPESQQPEAPVRRTRRRTKAAEGGSQAEEPGSGVKSPDVGEQHGRRDRFGVGGAD